MDLLTILAADIGAKALWLLYAWLVAAAGSAELARRAGYSEKLGLGTGLVFSVVALVVWIAIFVTDPRGHRAAVAARRRKAPAAS
jgi:hypothetical protein